MRGGVTTKPPLNAWLAGALQSAAATVDADARVVVAAMVVVVVAVVVDDAVAVAAVELERGGNVTELVELSPHDTNTSVRTSAVIAPRRGRKLMRNA